MLASMKGPWLRACGLCALGDGDGYVFVEQLPHLEKPCKQSCKRCCHELRVFHAGSVVVSHIQHQASPT